MLLLAFSIFYLFLHFNKLYFNNCIIKKYVPAEIIAVIGRVNIQNDDNCKIVVLFNDFLPPLANPAPIIAPTDAREVDIGIPYPINIYGITENK